MNEQNLIQARKQNMKVYSLYRAISLDLIFYYSIEFLFLTQVKCISPSEVVLGTSFYSMFMIFFQIPASMIVDRIGTRKCTILANALNSLFVLLILCCDNFMTLIFAQFISSLCFSLKDISDPALLKYSIPNSKKQGEIFSKIEGKGYKNYFLLNAFSGICCGFLYMINPYIPMIVSLGITILSTVISIGFQDIPEGKNEKQTAKQYLQEIVTGVKFITKSERLRSLFLYSGIAWGIFSLMSTYRSSLLVDIGVPVQIITIICALGSMAASIGSKKQIEFHNRFRNKTLSMILYITMISIFIIGIMGILNFGYEISLFIVVCAFSCIYFAKGVSEVITKRYLGNFVSNKILTQIYAVNAISRNIFRAIIGFVGSYLLSITNTANSMIVIAILLFITILGLVSYMKTRLGKKPEEYDEKEIFYKKEWDK